MRSSLDKYLNYCSLLRNKRVQTSTNDNTASLIGVNYVLNVLPDIAIFLTQFMNLDTTTDYVFLFQSLNWIIVPLDLISDCQYDNKCNF